MSSNCTTQLFVGSLKIDAPTCVEHAPIHTNVEVGAT
jgi:hypothetical protein